MQGNARVTESNGFKLHLSSRNSTGYAGINYQPQARGTRPYQAQRKVNGKQQHIGYYATAVEAAVVYARRHARGARHFPGPSASQPSAHRTRTLDLLSCCLSMDPELRATAPQALRCSIFNEEGEG